MKQNPALKDRTPKGTAPTANSECSTRLPPAPTHWEPTGAGLLANHAAGRGGRALRTARTGARRAVLSRSPPQTGPEAAGWPRSSITITLKDESLGGPFHLNPLSDKGQSTLSRGKKKHMKIFPERTSYKQEQTWTLYSPF